MKQKLDPESLANEIHSILEANGLKTQSFGIYVSLSGREFDLIAADYPGQHPRMVLVRKGNEEKGVQWFVQISKERSLEDFPPGAILTPPS